jgi:diguanylate cyclase (GGDEF)-like protein
MDYNSLYVPNSIVDFTYIASLAIIAFGALWKTYKNCTLYNLTIITNIGGKKRWVYLLFFPFLAVFLMISHFVDVQVDSFDMLTFAILIFIYWAACKYIQLALEKEAMLKQQNEILEQRVAEQVIELTFLANQDTLTTLFNRRHFMACLDGALKNKRPDEAVALLLIDVDRFKTINDTFGHDVGDMVLIDISRRMIAWNRYGATLARLGGDEFAVMVAGKYTQKDIEDFCKEIIDLYVKPTRINENTLSVTMSVGVTIITADACDGKTAMQNADIAMYRAKAQGYNKYQVYDAFMSQDYRKTLEIETLLKQTDAEKDFELYYQPQYALPGKELIGAEALIRWSSQEHGFIPPNVFIPIAEQIDFIFKIGEWVVQETVRQAEKWNKKFDLPLKSALTSRLNSSRMKTL